MTGLNADQRYRIAAYKEGFAIGTSEDIAAACLYLTSEEAGYVTGQIIGVNGGMVL